MWSNSFLCNLCTLFRKVLDLDITLIHRDIDVNTSTKLKVIFFGGGRKIGNDSPTFEKRVKEANLNPLNINPYRMANNWKGLLNKILMMIKILSTINTCSNGGLTNLTGYLTRQDGIPEISYANTCKLNDCFILPYRS